ncbi:MAG: DNA cytosine methyltransferase [Nitrososphaerota archaeon]|nr:DNA cytosine methyltransferase [Nitrososphaerota archaeon]
MKVVSIFSGSGGTDLGFLEAGYEIIFANDINRIAVETYRTNLHVSPSLADIRAIKKLPKADVLVACNPCQGFSIIGKRDENDPRNALYKEIFRCLKLVKPKYFLIENVKGLAVLYNGKFLRRMLDGFRRYGYDVYYQILNAADYGVPQNRERIFIVGVMKSLRVEYEFPRNTHGANLLPHVTLRDAIGDLPEPRNGDYYNGRKWSFFYMSRNRRADWASVSYTIQTTPRNIPLHPSCPPMKKIGKDKYVFTEASDRYRRLSIRECARIQTFPDDFEFIGGLEAKYRQIGNAVPPLLAKIIAESIKKMDNCVSHT